ncbi:negative regulator of genetic competence [Thermoclostridium stercorarium subsp. stercorarium DSM 8532]|uniref:Negative regulator of genetic competence n=1 Tax=Thermoclostridium stercorarium (strain ATCC 35414 / DSM 8532 / NCIMB 11754) TaxID=1121335 RepID=L7VP77_THES1|nr:adaptor protein MecA [Thermoclostridium stercorarium]AGC67353.1 negative regulator of genetic competence [Thermoclostridium stercorarium subsp. stercorarium DSM 8532]AGI38414.1 regulator [Thermoclostridium stercorarium subsp. stercorarium DSM 8532]
MRIEKISENKIRIFVSFDDLEERDIDLSSFNYNSPETQELFWDLMEQAELELGFETNESQLCIEAVTDVDQGFIITITKIDDDSDFESIQKFIKNRYKKNDIKFKKKTGGAGSTVMIYNVESFEDLCNLCARLKPVYSGESSAYLCEGSYYLVLKRMDDNEYRIESILSEYGDRVLNVTFLEGYLNEYGKLMVGNDAVGCLGDLA